MSIPKGDISQNRTLKVPESGIKKDVDKTLKGVIISKTDERIVRLNLASGLSGLKEQIIDAKNKGGMPKITVKRPGQFRRFIAMVLKTLFNINYPLFTRISVIDASAETKTEKVSEEMLEKMKVLSYKNTYKEEGQDISLALRNFKDFTRSVGKDLSILENDKSVREVHSAKAFLEKKIQEEEGYAVRAEHLKELSKIYRKGMEKLVSKMPVKVLTEASRSRGYEKLAGALKRKMSETPKTLRLEAALNQLDQQNRGYRDVVMDNLVTFAENLGSVPRLAQATAVLEEIDRSHKEYAEQIETVLGRYANHELAQKPSEAENLVEHLEMVRQVYLEDPPWEEARGAIANWLETVDPEIEFEGKMKELQKMLYPIKLKGRLALLNHKLDLIFSKPEAQRPEKPIVSVEEFQSVVNLFNRYPEESKEFLSDLTRLKGRMLESVQTKEYQNEVNRIAASYSK